VREKAAARTANAALVVGRLLVVTANTRDYERDIAPTDICCNTSRCAIASATVTNRSSQAGQPMSTQTARAKLSEVSTMVEFMIVPFFATVASSQVTL
jgi:hypothetical protein